MSVPVLSTVLDVGGIVTVELWVNVIVDRTVEELVDVVKAPAALLVGELEVFGEEVDSLPLDVFDGVLEVEAVGEGLDSLLPDVLGKELGVEAIDEERDSLLVVGLDDGLEAVAEGEMELIVVPKAEVVEAFVVLYVVSAVGESDEELGASLDLLDVDTEKLLRDELGVAIIAEADEELLVEVVVKERLVG